MQLNHILAASDFSTASEEAFAIAARLAGAFGAKVTLIHSYDPEPLGPAQALLKHTPPEAETEIEKLRQAAHAELERARGELFGDIDYVTIEVLASSSAALSICDYAAEHDVDLIVCGTHGSARLSRWLIGGVTEKVVRHAPCSVLAVRRRQRSVKRWPSRIVAGTDFSLSADSALDVAAALHEKLGGHVSLVYCYDSAVRMLPALGGPEMEDEAKHVEQTKADLREALLELAQSKLGKSRKVTTELLVTRNSAAAMCGYADEHDTDLIVVGAEGRGGRTRMAIGGVAEKVLRHASCSVLTVRSGP